MEIAFSIERNGWEFVRDLYPFHLTEEEAYILYRKVDFIRAKVRSLVEEEQQKEVKKAKFVT